MESAKESAYETIVVVGLGYVGLPLAVAFGKNRRTIGFELNASKIERYRAGTDPMGEVSDEELASSRYLEYTTDPKRISEGTMIVVAVPTPIDSGKKPDFEPLAGASRMVGQNMVKGSTVIFESTVYPGATEEICVPLLEEESGLKWKEDFHVGYSPERVNPGDKLHRLENIVKVVSGDDDETLARVAEMYEEVVEVGVHRASSLKVAEAAKVIENTQRDLNIALMNELALIFDRVGIDTLEVLEAAGSKWNFLPFRPGLVGGHCIGVDPYYLTHKAEMLGYHPQVIVAGRRINDGMGKFVAERTVKLMVANGGVVPNAKIAVLGLTFKEDCPDLRNSRVIDVVEELAGFGFDVLINDPMADVDEAREEYGVELVDLETMPKVSAVVLAVAHKEYREMNMHALADKLNPGGIVVDVKSMLDRDAANQAGINIWRL